MADPTKPTETKPPEAKPDEPKAIEPKPSDEGTPVEPKADDKPAPNNSEAEALKVQLAALEAKLADAEKAKEAAGQTVAEQLAALKSEVESTKAEALASARTSMASKLGVKSQYTAFMPADADPRTEAGKSAIEKWAAAHPELIEGTAPKAPAVDLKDIDYTKSAYITDRSIRESMTRMGLK